MSLSCSLALSAFCTAESPAPGEALVGEAPDPRDAAELGEAEADVALTAAFNSCSLRFFCSCFLRSSALVELVNAIDFPSGDHAGSPAPFGRSVNANASPPLIGRMHSCGGSGLPSFSFALTNSRNFPSGDQRGVASWLPLVS